MPLALRSLLYLKVEAGMKKSYKLMIDRSEEPEEVDGLNNADMDRIWLDTGGTVVQLPDELIPYLQDSEILGIA